MRSYRSSPRFDRLNIIRDTKVYTLSIGPTTMSLAQLQEFSKSDERYEISLDFSGTLYDLLEDLLSRSTFTETGIGQVPSGYYDNLVTFQQAYTIKGRSYNLYSANGGNISVTLDKIAESLTNRMRSSVTSSNVTGTVHNVVVHIEVVWPWLIYPVALSICTATVLGATMWLAHSSDKMIWKSSSLALLFHGLDEVSTKERLLEISVMETVAESVWAKLSRDEEGNAKLKVL